MRLRLDLPAWQSSGTGVPRIARVYRRAYVLLVGNAVVMGALAVIVSIAYDKKLLDPESAFLGPSWLRLPLLCSAP